MLVLPGRLLSPHLTNARMFHTYTDWIVNTGLNLALLRKSPRVQQCLNNRAAVTRQVDATSTPNREEVSAERGGLGKATDNIFTVKLQGAEIVSTGSFLLFIISVRGYLPCVPCCSI